MNNESVKKVVGIVSKIFTWIVIAITVFMMIFTIFSTLAFNKNERNLFGIRFYVVLSDSMSPSELNKDDKIHFNAGDIILSQMVKDPTKLQPGDVISFISQNSYSFGETVTHMIREVRTDSKGRLLGYVTYGTNTGADDEALVEPEYILGKYAGKLPKVGYFFSFLKTTPGYIVCILVPFLILILWQGVNTVRLFMRYKKEQTDAMQAEKDKVEAERAETQRMMAELLALKAELEKKGSGISTTPSADPSANADDTNGTTD